MNDMNDHDPSSQASTDLSLVNIFFKLPPCPKVPGSAPNTCTCCASVMHVCNEKNHYVGAWHLDWTEFIQSNPHLQ